MRVFNGSQALDDSEHVAGRASARGCVLTVGNFDGLHVGHRKLLEAVTERAHALGQLSGVYTFDPHPRRVLQPESAPAELMTWEQLERGLEAAGIDLLVREPFTREFSSHTAEEFLRDVIAKRIAPQVVFVGRDFHFGKGRSGSGETLARQAPGLGITVEIIPQVGVDGSDVSSTRVRELLTGGDVEQATRCLGRPYTIWGKVELGDQRGRTLGFPTANLAPDNELIPEKGVYATTVRALDGDDLAEPNASVTNIGTRPTFEPGRVLVESHLLDFEGDLYGRRLELAFHARIRAEKRFSGPDELARQIARDADQARDILARVL